MLAGLNIVAGAASIDIDRQLRLGNRLMHYRKKLFAAALLFFASPAAHASPTGTSWGKVSFLAGGWSNSDLRLTLNVPFSNPENCGSTDGYIVPAALPANQLLSSMLMTAYSLDHSVALIIDGCYLDRPKVIGVYMQRQNP